MKNFAFEISSDKQLRYFISYKKTFFTTVHWQFLDIWTINDIWILFCCKSYLSNTSVFSFFLATVRTLRTSGNERKNEKDKILLKEIRCSKNVGDDGINPHTPSPNNSKVIHSTLTRWKRKVGGGGLFFDVWVCPKSDLIHPWSLGVRACYIISGQI